MRLRSFVVFIVTVAALTGTGLTPAEPQTRLILFGAHPSPSAGQSRVEAAVALQDLLEGPKLGLIRRYLLWEDEPQSDPLIDWTIQQGSVPLISVVPRRPDNSVVTWPEIATASPGTPVHDEMIELATGIASLEGEVWFTFHHEPEIVANLVYGQDSDFIAAYRRFVEEVRAAGGADVNFVWILTSHAFELDTSDRRSASLWYPGDAWVDQVGADPYNWLDCRLGIANDWRSLDNLAGSVRDFALAKGKPLVIAEFGSVEPNAAGESKADWVTDIRRFLREPGWEHVTAISTFNAVQPPPDSACRWFVDTSPESLEAYQGLINDELFGGTQGPPPPVPAASCTSEPVGATIEITWANAVGLPIVRRNGTYLGTPAPNVSSFTDTDPAPVSAYTLRLWGSGQYQDLDCGTVASEVATVSCTATLNLDGGVDLTWDSTPQLEVIRRNGSWIASPDPSAQSYIDTNPGPGPNSYVVRQWIGGTFNDAYCGTVNSSMLLPTCAATLSNDGRIEMTWANVLDGTLMIGRDGIWDVVVPPGATSWSWAAPPPGTYNYELRILLGAGRIDIACGSVVVP